MEASGAEHLYMVRLPSSELITSFGEHRKGHRREIFFNVMQLPATDELERCAYA